jgi:hypothetical protein
MSSKKRAHDNSKATATKKKKPAPPPITAAVVPSAVDIDMPHTSPPAAFAEPTAVTTVIVERNRKSKLNTRVPSDDSATLSARFGPHYIKTTFLMHSSCARAHATVEERELLAQYDAICNLYKDVEWQINRAAMDACSMMSAEVQRACDRKRVAENIENQPTLPPSHVAAVEEPTAIDFDVHVAQRRRKRVLVPFSGGLSSMATLWWCLRKDYDIYLCYAFGALDATATIAEKPAEIECLLRLLEYARTVDGKLLFNNSCNGGVHGLTRAEINARIRIVQVPQASYNMPAAGDAIGMPPFADDVNGQRCKAHPQAYLLLYRHLLTVAESLQCSGIALGMHGDAKQLLQSAQKFFTKIHTHDLVMPFANRTEALVCLQEAATQSWHVWRSYFENGDVRQQQQANGGVWQTCGPALMPNVAHYVTTCSAPPRLSVNELMTKAQEAAVSRIVCLLQEEAEKEQEKIDAALQSGKKLRKKRTPDPLQYARYTEIFLEEKAKLSSEQAVGPFHFCRRCADCRPWRQVVAAWDEAGCSKRIAPHWQNLFCEYLARLDAASVHTRGEPSSTIAVDAKVMPARTLPAAAAQELTLQDLPNEDSSDEFIVQNEDEEPDAGSQAAADVEEHAVAPVAPDEDDEACAQEDDEDGDSAAGHDDDEDENEEESLIDDDDDEDDDEEIEDGNDEDDGDNDDSDY